jgi:hypothetical protein
MPPSTAHIPLFEESGMRKAMRYFRCLQLFLPLALISLSLFGLLPCQPVMAAPLVTLSASSGPVGLSVTISGSVFSSFEGDAIHILFDNAEFTGGAFTIPAGGDFSFDAVIPVNAAPGLHHIWVKSETTNSSVNISVPFTVQERALALSSPEGHVGLNLTLNGSGFCVGQAVTIDYFNPADGIIGTVTASPEGTFTHSFTIPAGVGGEHKFTASNEAGNSANATFRVIPEIILNVASASPGEYIHVTGSGFGDTSAVSLTFDSFVVASAATNNTGNFEVQFAIPVLPLTNYNLKAQDSTGNTAQVLFPLTAGAIFSENAGSVGDTVKVTGDGFKPSQPITINFDDAAVASETSDSNGDFIINFTIPPCKGGGHVISVSDGSITRHYDFAVETQAPPPPVLLLPEYNGMSGGNTRFSWESVKDTSVPVTYDLVIASDRDFTDITINKTGITGAQYTLNGGEALVSNASKHIYYWKMAATDGAGNRSGWTIAYPFYVDFPTEPSALEPTESANLKFPIVLKWQAVTDLSKPVTYSLQISRNIEFTALLVDEKGLTSAAYSILEDSKSIFVKNYTYYWKVKAVDAAGNASGWSAASTFSIAPNGFPAWAGFTLAVLAVVILGLVFLRLRKKTSYQYPDSDVIQ